MRVSPDTRKNKKNGRQSYAPASRAIGINQIKDFP